MDGWRAKKKKEIQLLQDFDLMDKLDHNSGTYSAHTATQFDNRKLSIKKNKSLRMKIVKKGILRLSVFHC